MPVWHERTRAAREAGTLRMIGVVPEQHRDRTRLFAQWQELDWPLLWDPFSLTGSKVVPAFVAIDEHGIVRQVNPRGDAFEREFLEVEFPAPAEAPLVPRPGSTHLVEVGLHPPGSFEHEHARALSAFLFDGPASWDEALAVLERDALAHQDDGRYAFRAGVARRMRYDARGVVDDFRAAVSHWRASLDVDPSMYIVRRRLQQYGPRMDKPYPFYAWVDEARAAIVARGDVPHALRAPLTPAELAQPRRGALETAPATEPDPGGKLARDETRLVALEPVVTWATGERGLSASVHVVLLPDDARDVHWTNGVAPTCLWLAERMDPPGYAPSARLVEFDEPATETSSETRTLSFDVELPPGTKRATVSGYALYAVCEGASGECVVRRRDFTVPLDPPE